MKVLAIAERGQSGWHPMSGEAIAAARSLTEGASGQTTTLAIGAGVAEQTAELGSWGAGTVIAADHPALATYSPHAYAAVVEAAVKAGKFDAVVFPHTYQVRDYGPKAATALGRPFVSDVVGMRVDGGQPVFVRQMFQGKLNADVSVSSGAPYFLSVQSGAFTALSGNDPGVELERLDVTQFVESIRVQADAPFRESAGEIDLTKAKLIVSVGRGIKDPENIKLAEELAAALGAELAASRPICDAGWMPLERQVGSSGQTVSPDAYIALGISGAIQHVVGMKGAKTIVAINTDKSAPIFEIADYGIVADLFEVVPALVKRLQG